MFAIVFVAQDLVNRVLDVPNRFGTENLLMLWTFHRLEGMLQVIRLAWAIFQRLGSGKYRNTNTKITDPLSNVNHGLLSVQRHPWLQYLAHQCTQDLIDPGM